MSTDFSKMSDFEINKCVAKIYGGFALTLAVHNEPPSGKSFDPGVFDPCNNPADAWPIIVENKIMLSPRCADDEWKAQIHLGSEDIFDNYASAWHKNPLRAAMIVFLMMQESKNAS